MQFSRDPLINAIYQGIKRGIQITLDNQCYGPCLVLIYCGIDTMAYLDMPIDQDEVRPKDFIQWAGRYLSPKLSSGATQITGEELYSARCAVVHTYTVESRGTKSGSARKIGYMIGGKRSLVYDPQQAKDFVLLQLEILCESFFKAIDSFLMESYADKKKQPILDARLKKLLNAIPY